MTNLVKCTFIIICIFLNYNSLIGQSLYLDEKAPIHDRIIDLLSIMTVEEKISLLRETAPAIERLGIDKFYHGNEALHGVVRPGNFTVFPQAIGLAAMWNPDLHFQIATAISDEARGRWNELGQGKNQVELYSDLLAFWSPTVNMARDPRWGRTPETYGEDPFLSGVLGTQFVKGLQGNHPKYLKVIATPKHFAANNEEHNRFHCNVEVTERLLREYYFPAFEACIIKGEAASIMAAYPSINEVPCMANPWLLQKVLRDDWGFKGYVVGDCGGVANLVTAHKYVKTEEAAATLALKAGLDLECGNRIYLKPLLNAYKQYMVSEAEIDTAAYRVLLGRMRLGVFDHPANNPYNKIPPSVIGSPKHQELALEAARQSIVLLKNEKKILPIQKGKVKTIAVVGMNAANCEFGDYSGKPINAPVSILDGIKKHAGKNYKILHSPWIGIDGTRLIDKAHFPQGLKAEYFSNTRLEGTPKVRVEEWINYEPANQPPDPFVPQSPLSIRWSGKLHTKTSGEYTFKFTGDDGYRVFVNDKKIIDKWHSGGLSTDSAKYYLDADKSYELKVEYFDHRDHAEAKLSWKAPTMNIKNRMDMHSEAFEAARESDLVIAVVGTNRSIEREGQDRTEIKLTTDQEEFVREIYRVNPNTVVVLVSGSPLAIDWIDKNIPAILNAWYPGEQGGTAVAEILFGNYNPGGRLPLTYHNSLDEIPAFDDYDITKGRTYQYFKGKPLYPFGYGLSYTSFRYRNIEVQDMGSKVSITFDLKNVGTLAGDEVSQLYVKLPEIQDIKLPIKQLKGFKRIHLSKGQEERIEIQVEKSELRYWDEKQSAFVTPKGEYLFMVGASSEDIRLTKEIIL